MSHTVAPTETCGLGFLPIDAAARQGPLTDRARRVFAIGWERSPPRRVDAIGTRNRTAARANLALGELPPDIAEPIMVAAARSPSPTRPPRPACAAAVEATLVLRSARGARRVAAERFFGSAMSTTLEAGGIGAAVEFPTATEGETPSIAEIARRAGDGAMARLCLGHGPRMARTRLVFFGVGGAPRPARAAMAALEGRPVTPERLAAAQAALDSDLDPPARLPGPPEMKRHLARVLLARALLPREKAARASARPISAAPSTSAATRRRSGCRASPSRRDTTSRGITPSPSPKASALPGAKWTPTPAS